MGLIYSPKIVTDGLVLCLDAGSPKSYAGSGTTWTDRSGNGNHGTLVNGPSFSSANRGSIVFDGTNDYVSLPNNGIRNLLSTDCTIMVTFSYATLASLVYPTLIGCMNYSGQWAGWRLVFTASNRTLTFINGSASNGSNQSGMEFNYTFPDNINEFTHIACTWKVATGSKDAFINGTLTNSVSSSTYGFGASASLTPMIGSTSNGYADNFFKGRVASVNLYNRVLSPAEILQNYNATKSRFGL
jgi:hypothetical protein